MTAVAVAAFCVALEGAKCCWHAYDRGRSWLFLVHALLAAALAGLLWPILAPVAALTVMASALALDAKRKGRGWGQARSALSSWPWEAAGLASLGWVGAWVALPTGWLCGLWWVSGMRPVHWTPSVWTKAYPLRLRRFLGDLRT